tara:strand:+ start:1105 stop:1392 length:288 start_codon:yes stop_codon:yes gene_type:complete
MRIFDFLRPKKSKLDRALDDVMRHTFPNGSRDINAGADELLLIIDHKVSREEAQEIFVGSVAISRMSKRFDEERLRLHLIGSGREYFNDEQVHQF